MSQEEKLNRRKLKNRVAAQSARDRKKAKMDDMEGRVSRLAEERMKLQRENEHLKRRNLQLETENTELKHRLGQLGQVDSKSDSFVERNPEESTVFESAALINASQQQKQGRQVRLDNSKQTSSEEEDVFPWMMPFVCWLVAIENLMRSSHGWRSVLTNFLKENLTKAPPEIIEMVVRLIADKELSSTDEINNILDQIPRELLSSLRTKSSPLGT
jgi:hypothetical protein